MLNISKRELIEILLCDSANYSKQSRTFLGRFIHNLMVSPMADQKYIWLYIKTLRYVEFYKAKYTRSRSLVKIAVTIPYVVSLAKLRKLSYRTGFQIPPFVCGKGLTIWHFGPIIINERAVIGDYCTLYPGVLIGSKEPGGQCPIIGNNVFIGSGAKIIGPVRIGDNVIIGQNCVITEDIPNGSKVVNYHCSKIIKQDLYPSLKLGEGHYF